MAPKPKERTGLDHLAAMEENLNKDDARGPSDDAAERLDTGAAAFAEGSAPAPAPPIDESGTTAPEPAARQKRKYKRRTTKGGTRHKAAPSSPNGSTSSSAGGSSVYRSNTEMRTRVAELEATIERMSQPSYHLSEEDETELRDQLEGAIISAQMIGTQVVGKYAVLTVDQKDRMVDAWIRPARRAIRWLNNGDDGPLPSWLGVAITLFLSLLSTMAILFPNWQQYIDDLPVDQNGQPIMARSPQQDGRTAVELHRASQA